MTSQGDNNSRSANRDPDGIRAGEVVVEVPQASAAATRHQREPGYNNSRRREDDDVGPQFKDQCNPVPKTEAQVWQQQRHHVNSPIVTASTTAE